MKRLFLLIFISFIFQNVFSQNKVTEVTIVKTENKTIINKHIYGHFAEHLGKCIYEGLFVGENSTISNTKGVRNDIIKALQDLKVPNLRWPGGCFADTYHWKDGIGPKKDRPSIVNRWWGGTVEDNSFGTNEFLDMCEVLGAEPYLAGNVGSGSPRELEEWVQYVNYESGSPMSDLRKKNGREKPWKVALWGVGNEMWGCGGNMTVEFYANLYRQYATFMPDGKGDKKLFRIASGANGDDYHWTEVLMRDIPKGLVEAVALHWYSVINWEKKGSSTKFDESQYFETMNAAVKMEELVQKHAAIMDKYDPEKKVALIVDEWGGWYDTEEGASALYQQNTMRDAMIAGVTLNVFNNHADRVKGANLAQIVNVLQAVILTDKEKMVLTPTYHVMKMYNVHQDAQLIPLKIESPKYVFDNKELPAVSISASKDKTGLTHISLVNIDLKKENKVKIDLKELGIKNIKGSVLSSSKIQDYNTFENPNKIAPAVFNKFSIKNDILEVTIPPFSVVVLEGK
ncbi:alpha-N-arabinofuranosidase [Flavobacterium sp. CF108]|uniref:alpha-N-arabinofuranosidase n=1 Tax=unclassified Flavobacterium TaxID=196869 RepID=UPI0008B164A8|nr:MULTISPECIES: alpha-L-arabinofuranosidase C-terminal domain-containing protein [unclassified Flavobacterium]SEP03517.1 alpha-N-arabinofuranosidase [Flavobacterium sp. fv08]SHH97922.1 alpha-N-arabinofuranosidase [Flavobacterium sp. CF108]